MRLFDYISRIGKSRGFGIQSPWAFSFVKDVIMEKLPYYNYEVIDSHNPNKKDRKKQKLYFRIRNYVHNNNYAEIDITTSTVDEVFDNAISFGNKGVLVLENIYSTSENKEKWFVIRDSKFIGITFDLYFCAICFMPNGMYKQHYKLNF